MTFVNVRLQAPDGKRYRVEIDSDLNVETVKSQLLQQLEISDGKKYEFHLVDSFSLSAGNEILLVETKEKAIRGLELENG